MIIRFIGHMCHFITSHRVYAVMFTVPDHEVRLRVEEQYTDYEVGDPEYTGDPLYVHCYPIAGSTVSFASNGASATARNLTGLIPVPSLNLLGGAGKTVHADVTTPNPTGAFNVFVDVPYGDYGIEDWYEYKATFNAGKTYVCVPRTITFSAPSTDVWTITGVVDAPTLTADAIITITNLETQAVGGSHYSYHGRLFNPSIVPTGPLYPDANAPKCDDGTADPDIPLCPDQAQQDLSVECSNTRYP